MADMRPLSKLDEQLRLVVETDAANEAADYRKRLAEFIEQNGLKEFPIKFSSPEAERFFVETLLSSVEHAFKLGYFKAMEKVEFDNDAVSMLSAAQH